MTKTRETLRAVTIRFAGDSGDGMQLTGEQYAHSSALAGNDIATFPDFPAEIRAPAGSLAGVSGFQLQFSSFDIHTPGDRPDVLVAMNPAALQRSYRTVRDNGIIVVDKSVFSRKNLNRAGFESDPLEDDTLAGWRVYPIDITKLTQEALKDSGLTPKQVSRCKNFFALGVMFWLYTRPIEPTLDWIAAKFVRRPDFIEANQKALKTGYHFGETTALFQVRYEVAPAPIRPGKYRKIRGNAAAAMGFVVGAKKANLDLFLGTYPITPASDILHELAKLRAHGVRTVQCEDEIAAASMALGASYAGSLGLTTSSGPGIALKSETIGLAVITELPLVIVNVQRGGPSTGLPTKTEQADLLMVLHGRNGESPVPVLAASSPGDCFWTAIEAVRLAIQYMTPVFFLSDGYLANGAEPWLIPNVDEIPAIDMAFHTDADNYQPYQRNERLARPWVRPGTPGLEHRIGGLEKEHLTGNVSYDPQNHEDMIQLRAEKVARIADEIPPLEVLGPERGELLLLGWGGTFGAIRGAVNNAHQEGRSVAQAHLRHLNPFPKDLEEVLRRYDQVVIPELNLGQLCSIIRGRFLIDVKSKSKLQGQPFTVTDIRAIIEEYSSQPSASLETAV